MQKKNACGRISTEEEAASGEAGQSRGVVRPPRRSHLPAVRAVSGIYEGVPKAVKIGPRALQNEKSPLFQGKQRGCRRIFTGKTAYKRKLLMADMNALQNEHHGAKTAPQ